MQANISGMDPNLLAEMRPGERVLWWGRPNARRRVMNSRTRRSFWYLGLASVLALILIGFDGFVFLSLHALDGSLVIAVMLINAGLLFGILQPAYSFMQGWKHLRALRYTIYAITDQRALLLTAVPGKSRGVVSYAKADIGTISRFEGKEGWGDLVFGLPRTTAIGGRRVVASASFGGIPQVRMVEEILFRTFKQDEKAAPLPLAGEQIRQE